MTTDIAFARRVVRLAIVSAVALGVIRALSYPGVQSALAEAAWLLMPVLLIASLRRPRLRYALLIPATLLSIAVTMPFIAPVAMDGVETAGRALLLGGVLLGDTLGVWFWFRLLPAPAGLQNPFSRGRMLLIELHAALLVSGLLLICGDALTTRASGGS